MDSVKSTVSSVVETVRSGIGRVVDYFRPSKQEIKTAKEVVCEKPYIRFGKTCCLDKNGNNICDSDE